MDRVGLAILQQELAADAAIMADAVRLAAERLADEHPGHLSACGYGRNPGRERSLIRRQLTASLEDAAQDAGNGVRYELRSLVGHSLPSPISVAPLAGRSRLKG